MLKSPGATLQAMATCLLLQATILAGGSTLLSRLEPPGSQQPGTANHSLK